MLANYIIPPLRWQYISLYPISLLLTVPITLHKRGNKELNYYWIISLFGSIFLSSNMRIRIHTKPSDYSTLDSSASNFELTTNRELFILDIQGDNCYLLWETSQAVPNWRHYVSSPTLQIFTKFVPRFRQSNLSTNSETTHVPDLQIFCIGVKFGLSHWGKDT